MKLLHVVPTYLPATRYGGPIVAVHGLCRALVRRGHEVSVFTTNVDGAGVSAVPVSTPVLMDGVEVTYFPTNFSRLYWSPAMGRALARRTSSFDIVHSHAIWLWPGIASGRAATRAKVPFVISPRGMLVNELIRRRSRFVKSAWLALMENRNFARASAIHFTSERERDDAAATGIPIPAPFVVPNGIDPSPRPNVARSGDTIVFLGRINWKKGLDALLVAMRDVPRAKLVIAGNDEEELTPKLRDIAREQGVEHRVTFRGPVYGEAKDELLASATLFVLPSTSENFGNVVVEAMTMQTPVIVTPGVGLAADVESYGAGMVAEPHELPRAMQLLLDDPARRAEMGRRGRALVESRFAWDHVAEEMEEAYRCTIRSPR